MNLGFLLIYFAAEKIFLWQQGGAVVSTVASQ